MIFGASYLPTDPSRFTLNGATMTSSKISIDAGGSASVGLTIEDVTKVTEYLLLTVIANTYTDAMEPAAFVDIIIRDDADYYRIKTPIINIENNIFSVPIKATALASYDNFVVTFSSDYAIEINTWELSNLAGDSNEEEIAEIEAKLPLLLYDYNAETYEVEQEEVTIGLISAYLRENADLNGHFNIGYSADVDMTLTIRTKDNEYTSLYTPLIYEIAAGVGAIGIPHAYLQKLAGIHTFTVTAQVSTGTLTLYPREVQYTIDGGYLLERLMDVGSDIRDITAFRGDSSPMDSDDPESVYAIGIDDGDIHVRYRAYSESGGEAAWTPAMIESLDAVPEAQTLDLDDASAGTFDLDTETLGWDATASEIQTALETLYGVGDVIVTGTGPFTITFSTDEGTTGLAADFTSLTATSPSLTVTQAYVAATTAEKAAIEFTAHWQLNGTRYRYLTDEEPCIFWIDNNDTLWFQEFDDEESRTQLATTVETLSTTVGYANSTGLDQGLIIAYVKTDGNCYYRNYTKDTGSYVWSGETRILFSYDVEIHTLDLDDASAGTFDLDTETLNWDDDAATIQAALWSLYGNYACEVTGTNPFTITWNVTEGTTGLTADFTSLTATSPSLVITQAYNEQVYDAVNVKAFRTNDYRAGVAVYDENGDTTQLLTYRHWVGIGIRPEVMDIALTDYTVDRLYITRLSGYSTEAVNLGLTGYSVDKLYGGPLSFESAENVNDGGGDWGNTIEITINEGLFDVTGNQSNFEVEDDGGYTFQVNSLAIKTGTDNKVLILNCNDFNVADYNKPITVTYTLSTGTIVGAGDQDLTTQSIIFTPTNLNPPPLDPPEYLSASNIEGSEL